MMTQEKLYKPRQIAELGLITNSKGVSDYWFVLKLIKSGRLKAHNYGNAGRSYFLVSPNSIKAYNKTIGK
jgi:hypothetical protein